MAYLPRNIDVHFILKVLRNEASQEERNFLDAWLAESDRHKEEYASLMLVWERSGRSEVPPPPDAGRMWTLLEQRLAPDTKPAAAPLPDHPPLPAPRSHRRMTLPWKAVGSVAALLFVVGSLVYGVLWLAEKDRVQRQTLVRTEIAGPPEQVYTTANGRWATIPLADGTVVHLHAASRLRVPAGFGVGSRQVELQGQAYFAVRSDPDRPFRVMTGASFTEVRGTEFDVRYRREKLDVIVSKGKVRVVSPRRGESVDLVRGQGVSAAPDGDLGRPRRVDLKSSLAWRENRLSFVQTPLDDVMAELEAVYDLRIEFRTASMKDRTLTGTFSVDSIDVVLSHIALAMDVSIRRDGRTVVVY